MNVLPVITRELRVQARQPSTYRMRLLAAVASLAACGWFLTASAHDRNIGGWLFGTLQVTLFYTTLLLVTFSAADCLSRERREGTLGLLFLTPLAAMDIVLAKGLAYVLRAATLVLAVLPIFALPMLLGGVSGLQLVCSGLMIFCAICLALGAALLASAWSKSWTRALVAALLLLAVGWLMLTFALGTLLFAVFARSNTNFYFDSSLDYAWLAGVALVNGTGIEIPNGSSLAAGSWMVVITQAAVLALVWLLAAIWLAARKTRDVWRELPPSVARQWVERKFTTPVVGLKFYRGWMRRLLNRNPVGWLQRRSWQGRLVTWTWLAIVISVTSNALGHSNMVYTFSGIQTTLAWLLAISMAATVAGSFRRERETGVLELLLVSPLSARRIIFGRLLGLWGQFLPAVGLFFLTWAYIASLLKHQEDIFKMTFFLMIFVTLPVIGLYFSLRCASFIGAFVLALAVGLAVPGAVARLTMTWLDSYYSSQYRFQSQIYDWTPKTAALVMPLVLQFALAAWLLWLTRYRLERRQFAFEAGGAG